MKQANFGDGAVVGVRFLRFYVCFRHFCLISPFVFDIFASFLPHFCLIFASFTVCFRHFCLIFASFHRNVWAELGPLLQAIVTVLGAELAVFLIGNAKNQEKAARKAAKRLKKD